MRTLSHWYILSLMIPAHRCSLDNAARLSGLHKSQEVIFLGDSGYDCAKIEIAIMEKKWKFIIALSKTRSVKSEKQYLSTHESKNWTQIAGFFKNHRWLKWLTIRILTNGSKIKRKDFRIRQITGYLRNGGKNASWV
jgi:hypothetical protein